METYLSGDYQEVLRTMTVRCQFRSVKHIVLTLNVNWDKITIKPGTHWLLCEMNLTTDNIILYSWIDGRSKVVFTVQCVNLSLKILHARYIGIPRCVSSNTEPLITVVKQHAQCNGYDNDVWTMYTLYWRSLNRDIRQDPLTLFVDMNLKDQFDVTQFRSLHIQSTFASLLCACICYIPAQCQTVKQQLLDSLHCVMCPYTISRCLCQPVTLCRPVDCPALLVLLWWILVACDMQTCQVRCCPW